MFFSFGKVTTVNRRIDVQFFGDRTTSSVPSQNISNFLDGMEIMKKNMKRIGYEKAVKEAFIEIVRSTETVNKPKHLNSPIENAPLAPVRRSPRLANDRKEVPATKISNITSEGDVRNPVRRSPRFSNERKTAPAIKLSNATSKENARSPRPRFTNMRKETRRSERLRQKQLP